MKKEKLNRFLRLALLVLACMTCAAIFLLNIIYLAEVRYDTSEKVIPYWGFPSSLFLLVAILLLAAILTQLDGTLEKINQRKLFCILSAIYTGIALYLVLNVEPTLRADAGAVHTAAQQIRGGITSPFKEGVISINIQISWV